MQKISCIHLTKSEDIVEDIFVIAVCNSSSKDKMPVNRLN